MGVYEIKGMGAAAPVPVGGLWGWRAGTERGFFSVGRRERMKSGDSGIFIASERTGGAAPQQNRERAARRRGGAGNLHAYLSVRACMLGACTPVCAHDSSTNLAARKTATQKAPRVASLEAPALRRAAMVSTSTCVPTTVPITPTSRMPACNAAGGGEGGGGGCSQAGLEVQLRPQEACWAVCWLLVAAACKPSQQQPDCMQQIHRTRCHCKQHSNATAAAAHREQRLGLLVQAQQGGGRQGGARLARLADLHEGNKQGAMGR